MQGLDHDYSWKRFYQREKRMILAKYDSVERNCEIVDIPMEEASLVIQDQRSLSMAMKLRLGLCALRTESRY